MSGNNTLSSSILNGSGGGSGTILQSDSGTLTPFREPAKYFCFGLCAPIYFQGAGNFALGGTVLSNTSGNETSIVKYGSGKLTLTGTNTYGGGTSISAGTVLANNSTSSLGIGSTSITGTGVLAGISGNTGGAVVVGDGTSGAAGLHGTITAGSGATPGDSISALNTGTQTWKQRRTFVVRSRPTAAARSPATTN